MAKIAEENMIQVQKLLRQVILIFGNISKIEERLARIRKESNDLYRRLDDIADGENQR